MWGVRHHVRLPSASSQHLWQRRKHRIMCVVASFFFLRVMTVTVPCDKLECISVSSRSRTFCDRLRNCTHPKRSALPATNSAPNRRLPRCSRTSSNVRRRRRRPSASRRTPSSSDVTFGSNSGLASWNTSRCGRCCFLCFHEMTICVAMCTYCASGTLLAVYLLPIS